jgi:hypothetical protein
MIGGKKHFDRHAGLVVENEDTGFPPKVAKYLADKPQPPRTSKKKEDLRPIDKTKQKIDPKPNRSVGRVDLSHVVARFFPFPTTLIFRRKAMYSPEPTYWEWLLNGLFPKHFSLAWTNFQQ